MPSTTVHGLPYPPLTGVTPNVPRDIQALATAVDGRLGFVGKSIIATSETTTSSTYTTLTTPDQIASVVLPTDGILQVFYNATWQNSAIGTANAAIFIDSTQITPSSHTALSDKTVASTGASGSQGIFHYLTSYWHGLYGDANAQPATPATPVTTGQTFSIDANGTTYGGPVNIFAAAGTYTLSVKFKTSTGTLTVKNRRLLTRVLPF